MERHLPIACGLDIHKDTIEACILESNGYEEPIATRKEFTTMRGDLFNLKNWLISHQCLNVAMESTGVYWKPVYELLEEVEGINVYVVNSYHMKNVPGRKTDANDAEWIATLFLNGLLKNSFVPDKGIRDLREIARFYKKQDQERVRIENRLEKFFTITRL